MASPSAGGGGGEGGALMPLASKGKARMDDDEAEGVTCGICLADARRAIRGELDCCGHHFCFVCIMAWARVESRCPFCKARFRTIRRPPVPGRFRFERIVTVAERNQVYHPLGNESSTVVTDPYANTSCSMCNCSRDDELLLLCELCDAAAHTYCVGLGTAVPEGDWFCKDCVTSKEEHSRCQIDDGGSGHQGGFEIGIEVPRTDPVAAPSIFDIVDEGYSPSSVHRTNVQSSRPSLVHPVPSIFDIVDEDYTTNPVCRTNARSTRPEKKAEHVPSQSTSSAGSRCPVSPQERDNRRTSLHAHARFEVERARTLRNSRNLNNRIRSLRENWPALRAGSVGFDTDLLNSRRENGTESVSVVREHQRCATPIVVSSQNGAATSSVKEHQQSSTPFIDETTNISGHANKISPKDTRNVRKAWKMLEMAKSAGGRKKSNKPSSLNCSPPFSMGNRSSSYSPIDTILGQMNQSLSNEVTQKNTARYDCGTKKENTLPLKNFEEHCSLPENYHVSVHLRMVSSRDRMTNQESLNGEVASSSHSQQDDQTLESLCGTVGSGKPKSDVLHPLPCSLSSGRSTVISSVQLGKPKSDVLHPLPCSLSSGRSTVISSVQLGPRTGSQSTTMVNPEEPSPVRVATANEIGTAGATVEVRKSSRPDRHECKRKLCFETRDDQGSKKSRTSCKIAKREISSLAIRELKLLKIDKTYGFDRFKEVARAATHTVLASCGLEHSPSVALAVSRPVCKHSSGPQPPKSSAITNSCRECLCNFVKDVISSVLSGKQMDHTAASC